MANYGSKCGTLILLGLGLWVLGWAVPSPAAARTKIAQEPPKVHQSQKAQPRASEMRKYVRPICLLTRLCNFW